jgi:hypothetical protein
LKFKVLFGLGVESVGVGIDEFNVSLVPRRNFYQGGAGASNNENFKKFCVG